MERKKSFKFARWKWVTTIMQWTWKQAVVTTCSLSHLKMAQYQFSITRSSHCQTLDGQFSARRRRDVIFLYSSHSSFSSKSRTYRETPPNDITRSTKALCSFVHICSSTPQHLSTNVKVLNCQSAPLTHYTHPCYTYAAILTYEEVLM